MKQSLLLLFCFCSTLLYGQFSMEAYLSQAPKASDIQTVQKIREYVSQTKFRSPLLREVEVRLRTRLADPDQNDYRLRFSPINPFERRANRNYRTAINRQMDAEYYLELNEVLLNQYEFMIAHYSYSMIKSRLEEAEAFYKRLLELVKKQPERFEIQDVVRLDKNLLEVQLEIKDTGLEMQQLEYIIRLTYNFAGSIEWNPSDLVTVPQINDWLENRNADIDNTLMVKNAIEESLVEASIYEVNRHESFSNMGFVQAEYERDVDNPFRENLGFQLGLSLPIFNSDRPDLDRRKMDVVESETQIEEERNAVKNDMAIQQMELQHLLEKHDMIVDKLASYRKLPSSALSGDKSLDAIREFEEYRMELELMRISSHSKLLKGYIALLALDGRLVEAPYLNYLSSNRTTFDLEF